MYVFLQSPLRFAQKCLEVLCLHTSSQELVGAKQNALVHIISHPIGPRGPGFRLLEGIFIQKV